MPIAHILSVFPKRSLATLILLTALQSQALTLGRIQGAALIGRPLAVSIGVQFDPTENLTSACFEADVFHGDAKQDSSRVKVRLESAASGQGHVLRVNSDTAVNEPVVTVYLRAGCAQMISRRYVILADIVSEQAAPVPRVTSVPLVETATLSTASATAAAAAGATSGSGLASAGSGAALVRAAASGSGNEPTTPRQTRAAEAAARPSKAAVAKPTPATKPAVVKRAAPQPAPSSATQEKARAGRAAGQSRLRLDPLELLSERVASLESVSANVPADAALREARDAQRLESLEASVKTLVALAAKNEASLLDLRTRLESAQAERYNNPVVYLLLALLASSLLALAYLLTHSSRRARQSPADNWWAASDESPGAATPVAAPAMARASERGPDSALSAISEPSPLSQPMGLTRPEGKASAATQPMTQGMAMRHAGAVPPQVDVSLVEMSESSFDRLMQSGSAHSAVRKPRDDEMPSVSPQPVHSLTPAAVKPGRRRIDSDELIDVRQRAEFFVSLGQTDQAVQVLEARIAQDPASCPQAYLDLLALFHSLGLKSDFLQVRDDFSRIFNVQVPEFSVFDEEGLCLEDYPGTVDRLIAVWSRASVLDVIEHLLYRQQGDTSHQPFDLAGFRDLLSLYAVAQAVVGGGNAQEAASADAMAALPTLDIDLSELIDKQGEPSIALPASVQAASSDHSSASPRDDNLIDFDLTEIPVSKNPDAS
jgi:hypothetical protein